MKQKITYLLFTLVLMACGNGPIQEVVKEKHPNNHPKLVNYVQLIDEKETVIEQITYYDNGQLKMGGNLEKGKRNGEWVAYFKNGQLQSKGEFENGVRTGDAEVYFPNGQLRYKGQYKNDKEIGHWKFYNEQGNLIKEEDF